MSNRLGWLRELDNNLQSLRELYLVYGGKGHNVLSKQANEAILSIARLVHVSLFFYVCN